MAVTREQLKAGLKIMQAVCETVREVGEAPSGAIYAALMGVCTLPAYESLVRQLVGTGLIAQRGDLLVWTGPKA